MIRIKTIVEDNKIVEKRFVQTNYAQSKPPGRCKFQPRRQKLTDPRFMSASQKRAHAAGEEVYV